VHGTMVYSAGVDPNGPTLERFPDFKKKKKWRKFTFSSKYIIF
jgi:hypothetical protein